MDKFSLRSKAIASGFSLNKVELIGMNFYAKSIVGDVDFEETKAKSLRVSFESNSKAIALGI